MAMDDKFDKTTLTNSNIQIPEGFGLEDKLCYRCFQSEEQRSYKPDPPTPTPPKDKKKDDSISIIWCAVLTFIIPWISFYYAYRTNHLRMVGIFIGIITAGVAIMIFTPPPEPPLDAMNSFFFIIGILGLYGSHIIAPIISVSWVLKWNEKIRSQSTVSSSNVDDSDLS